MIGIDGGATKVAGAQVVNIDKRTFDLVQPVKEIKYKTHESYVHNFKPLALNEQIKSKKRTELECRQAEVYIECIINVLDNLIDDENVQISIAMPGIKTLNKRGIELMANGPRIPNLCDEIEKRLTLKNKILQLNILIFLLDTLLLLELQSLKIFLLKTLRSQIFFQLV